MDQPGALQGQEYIETFEQLCTVTLQKPCFDGPYGRAWQGVMGRAYDTQMDRLYYAKECQWPDYTPTDALQYLAAERGLERTVIVGSGVAEDETLYRSRLRDAWTIWLLSGSQQGHINEMYWCGITSAQVRRRADFPNPPPSPNAWIRNFSYEVWAQFDIFLRQPMAASPLIWGAFTWGDAANTWGLNGVSSSQIAMLRRIVRNHKSAHDTCTYFWFIFGGGSVWGLWTWGSGTWGAGATVVGVVCGEDWWTRYGFA